MTNRNNDATIVYQKQKTIATAAVMSSRYRRHAANVYIYMYGYIYREYVSIYIYYIEINK